MEKTHKSALYRITRSQAINRTAVGVQFDLKSISPPKKDSLIIEQIEEKKMNRGTLKVAKELQTILATNNQQRLLSMSPTRYPSSTKSYTPQKNHFFISTKSPKNLFFKPKRLDANNTTTNMSKNHIEQSSIEHVPKEGSLAIIKSMVEVDFLSDTFFAKLMNKFPKTSSQRPITTVLVGRSHKQISVRHAQRIIQSLIDGLKFLKGYRFGDTSAKQKTKSVYNDLDEPSVKVEKFDNAICECLEMCQAAIDDRASRKSLDRDLKKMVELAQKVGNYELALYFIYLQGKICMTRCDFRQAIIEFKHYKELCVTYDIFSKRLIAYKMLGKCYQGLKMYKTSLIYFTKFLYMAWYIESPKHELLAYDSIGIQYYYLGDLDKAEHFHTRMVGGKLEPKGSRLRKIGITKIKFNKTTHYQPNGNKVFDFDADFDIDLHWNQNTNKNPEVDDEGGEVSSRDEGFEPPIADITDDLDNRNGIENIKKNKSGLIIRKSPPIKTIPGFVKAKIALVKKNEVKERNRTLSSFQSDSHSFFIGSKSPANIAHFRPTATAFFNCKPNEQILTSHLSRNRGLKNFSYSGNFNNASYNVNDKNGYNEDLDSKSLEQIKNILEKLKINLKVVEEILIDAGIRPYNKL